MNDRSRESFDLDELLHPAKAFGHPSEVVNDPDLTINEKRAILASWASDACAVEAAPELRSSCGGALVRFDDIMEALRTLDREANGRHYRRVMRSARRFRMVGVRAKAAPALRYSDQATGERGILGLTALRACFLLRSHALPGLGR